MTNETRNRLRELQDRWLDIAAVKYQVCNFGEETCIANSPNAPTFREVRETILPSWEVWFLDFFLPETGEPRCR
jgi:hypothetical protein